MGGGGRAVWGWASQLPAAMIGVVVWLPVAAYRQGVCRRQAGGDNGEKMAEAGAGLPSLGLAQIWLNSDCSTGRVQTLVLDLTAGM
jgi:hypothetical protein